MDYLINDNGTIREMTQDEIDALPSCQPEPPQVPSELELLKQRQELAEQALQDLILTMLGGE